MKDQNLTRKLDDFDAFCSFFGESSSNNYLLVGFSEGQQVKDVESALKQVDSFISKLSCKDDEGNFIPRCIHFIYGGDSYDVEKPTIAHIVKHLKENYKSRVKIFAIQNDFVGKVDEFVDCAYFYATEYENDNRDDNEKRVVWGGFSESQGLKGASRYYLGKQILGKLSGVLCAGGGRIAKEEVEFALKCALPIGWIQCQPKFVAPVQTVNDLLNEKLSKGLLRQNEMGFLV